MIGAVDRWIGRTLFIPPIVRACQRLGISQYRFHNYAYLAGSYCLLSAAIIKGEGETVPFVLALWLTILYGRNPDHEGYESPFLRRLFIVTNAIHIAAHASGESLLLAGPNWDWSCPVGLLWLAAEYARTIKTIPPLEEREPEVRRVVGEVV